MPIDLRKAAPFLGVYGSAKPPWNDPSCGHATLDACSNSSRLQVKCPHACQTQEILLAELASQRGDEQVRLQSRHALGAALQTLMEDLTLEAGKSLDSIPTAFHEAAVDLSEQVGGMPLLDLPGTSRLGGTLGYPLTVILAYLLAFNTFRDWVHARGDLTIAEELMSGLRRCAATPSQTHSRCPLIACIPWCLQTLCYSATTPGKLATTTFVIFICLARSPFLILTWDGSTNTSPQSARPLSTWEGTFTSRSLETPRLASPPDPNSPHDDLILAVLAHSG